MAETDSVTRSYFLSHNSGDDVVVRSLRIALAELDTRITIDSRDFYGGDPLESAIHQAIARSSGLLVLVSPQSHASSWVGRELKFALALQKARGGPAAFPVVPLLLDGTPLGAFEVLFDEPPIHVAIKSTELEAAPHAILVSLRLRLPTDADRQLQPAAEPVEELLLKLSEPSVVSRPDGSRRARAEARLVHVPATPGQREVQGARFALEAPLGVIEAADLTWYLEDYAVWPSPLLAGRAQRIEAQLEHWGRLLHEAALPVSQVAKVLESWATVGTSSVTRRFSVEVDVSPKAGAPDEEVQAMREAGTLLLGLPWELLHDSRSFLFQGAQPLRVRRRLPTEDPVPVPVLATPIRVLLVSPRPEDEACGYIDHRASAVPMVEAMEALAGQVELRLLIPPTLSALRDELYRARRLGQPYHVLHFDGHGVYNRSIGLGALCFEHEEDGKLARGPRRHALVSTPELGGLLRDHGIPLVFLEACQTAQAESASESVASALLKTGVGSVVAMTHSVLVETARRFVEAFYRALSSGERIGSAMLAGQRELKDRPVRGRVFGHGEFTLQDWFVPVLYQDRDDPQLFRQTPTVQTVEDWRSRLNRRIGELPPPPAQSFVGRSRELLALERLLAVERYAVLRGQGGEGKTALAAEFARWRVRARQVRRVAFASVESHGNVQAVLDVLGRQLVGKGYSVATHGSLEAAIEPVLRELREQPTLLVIDNLESVLAAPFIVPVGTGAVEDRDGSLAADDRERADAILALAGRLMASGDTRVVLTSREVLPAPFDGEMQRVELSRLSRVDAVQLVERTLGLDAAGQGLAAEAQRTDIESLVDAVHGHARTLSLLAPALRERGPAATQADLVSLMAEMERRFPGQREQSLLASVELSLRRLTPQMRERVKILGVFQGAMPLSVLQTMTGWEDDEVQALGDALVATGLATPEGYGQLSLNPALCPYLAAGWRAPRREELQARWTEAMLGYVEFLRRLRHERAEISAALTLMGLANLVELLNQVEAAGNVEATAMVATTLHRLLRGLNRPRLIAHIAQVRDEATLALGEEKWGHPQFDAEETRVEQLLEEGRVAEALVAAERLHGRMLSVGDRAYQGPDYDYDQALACYLLGHALGDAGQPEAALPKLEEAQRRFEAYECKTPGRGSARMALVAVSLRGQCLRQLGRLDEAERVYERAIVLAEEGHDERSVAVDKFQMAHVRMSQGRFPEALAAYTEACDCFEALGEPRGVAAACHQIGMAHQFVDNGDAAEDAYRKSLAISVQINDVARQAGTLLQLGNLYVDLGRPDEATTHYRHAAERFAALHDLREEGQARSNLAEVLRLLGRLADARCEIERAIECKQDLGHGAQPWLTWGILADIESDEGRSTEARWAHTQARGAYLAYRRDGGEASTPRARWVAEVCQLLAEGDATVADELLQQLACMPEPAAWLPPLIAGLRAFVAGVRNPSIADTPGLDYRDAAELLLLLETLKSG
jgi:tetratricopeptide (TPR) repeat protein